MQAILLLLSSALLWLGWWCSLKGGANPVHAALSIQFFVFGAFLAAFTCFWGHISSTRD